MKLLNISVFVSESINIVQQTNRELLHNTHINTFNYLISIYSILIISLCVLSQQDC